MTRKRRSRTLPQAGLTRSALNLLYADLLLLDSDAIRHQHAVQALRLWIEGLRSGSSDKAGVSTSPRKVLKPSATSRTASSR